MYAVTVRFETSAANAAAFHDYMIANAAHSLKVEGGCQRFDVCRNVDAPHIIFLYELYENRAAFDAHLSSAHFKRFDAAAGPLVLSKEIATFDQVAT